MPAGFPGFGKEALQFLRGLENNNNREWFQARKKHYEEHLKAPMTTLVEAINKELVRFAPGHVTEPKAGDARFAEWQCLRKSGKSTLCRDMVGH